MAGVTPWASAAGPLDVISGPALVIGGVLAAGVVLVVAFVAEALVLLAMRRAAPLRCARDSLAANMASGALGIVLALVFYAPLLSQDSPAPIALGSWALSVAVEGALLRWLGGAQPAWRPWVESLAMNTVSYGLVFGIGFALSGG